MKKGVKKVLILITLLFASLFLIRTMNYKELDDVTPAIPCNEELLNNADILWIIPNFEGTDISKNKTWCDKIKNLNKTIGLHGYSHTYREFEGELKQIELNQAINIFENCLGYKPTMFKPPQLYLSKENQKLLKEYNLTLKYKFNQATHKVYHCNNSGILPNKFIEIF